MAEEGLEGRSGPLADVLREHARLRQRIYALNQRIDALDHLPLLQPYPVRMDMSADVYQAVHSMAPTNYYRLFGDAALPRELQTGVSVIVHYDYPVGSMGVTYSDGHVESYQF